MPDQANKNKKRGVVMAGVAMDGLRKNFGRRFRPLSVCLLLVLACAGFLTACLEVSKPQQIKYMKDAQGRALVLHGVNVSSSAKHAAGHMPFIDEAYVERSATEWGFNSVRFLVFWAGLEPEKGVYDEHYLDEVETRVKWYTDRGVHVMIDMHQDIYSEAVGGNGAPAWATDTDGKTPGSVPGSDKFWWLGYLDPATTAAFKNFWEYGRRADLQDHYISAYQHLAQRFASNPGVIGYDLMNEPFPGDLPKALDGSFQKTWLNDFYKRLIPALRAVEPNKYLFFEPQSFGINFGFPSALPKQEDTRNGESRLVYAPHIYPLFLHEGQAYSDIDRQQMRDWSKNRSADLNLQQTPLMVGEIGGSDSTPGFSRYLDDVMNMMDAMGGSWSWWSADPGSWGMTDANGNEMPKANKLVRTYPRAIAGEPVSFSYEPNSADFNLTFKQAPGVSGPTEIFIPKRHYPDGWELEVSDPQGTWTSQYDDVKQVLKIWTAANQAEHKIRVHRKFQNIYATHLGKCLGMDYGNTGNGTQAVMWECGGQADQGWIVATDNSIRSKKATGQCLDVAGGVAVNANKVQLWQCNGSNAQKWYVDRGLLRSGLNRSKCLDVAYGGDSTKMQLWDCSMDAASQTFTMKAEAASIYAPIKLEANGLCLDINGGSMSNGTRVLSWSCHGGANQAWHYDAQTGHVHSKKNSNYCLDNRGNTQAGGTEWGIWRCMESDNLRFYWTGNSLRPYRNVDLLMQADHTGAGAYVHQQAGDGTAPLSRWLFQP